MSEDNKFYIYKFLNENNEVMYVGKTINLFSRIHQYFSDNGHLPFDCYCKTRAIQYIELNNEFEQKIIEIFFINYYKSTFNKEYSGSNVENNKILNEDYIFNFKWESFNCQKLCYFSQITSEKYYNDYTAYKKETDDIRNEAIKQAYLGLNLAGW